MIVSVGEVSVSIPGREEGESRGSEAEVKGGGGGGLALWKVDLRKTRSRQTQRPWLEAWILS